MTEPSNNRTEKFIKNMTDAGAIVERPDEDTIVSTYLKHFEDDLSTCVSEGIGDIYLVDTRDKGSYLVHDRIPYEETPSFTVQHVSALDPETAQNLRHQMLVDGTMATWTAEQMAEKLQAYAKEELEEAENEEYIKEELEIIADEEDKELFLEDNENRIDSLKQWIEQLEQNPAILYEKAGFTNTPTTFTPEEASKRLAQAGLPADLSQMPSISMNDTLLANATLSNPITFIKNLVAHDNDIELPDNIHAITDTIVTRTKDDGEPETTMSIIRLMGEAIGGEGHRWDVITKKAPDGQGIEAACIQLNPELWPSDRFLEVIDDNDRYGGYEYAAAITDDKAWENLCKNGGEDPGLDTIDNIRELIKKADEIGWSKADTLNKAISAAFEDSNPDINVPGIDALTPKAPETENEREI